ncbi:FMN-binding protein [Streptomyces sp. NPDC001728]|uniref:FMN-binding protein n=1 Tax=Streptomyces sp. NPDC001728 TaxID=3154396 RepID=UPI0033212636
MRAHSLRRTLLTGVGTVTVTVLALSLKPHHVPSVAAPVTPPLSSSSSGTGPGAGPGSASSNRTVTGSTVQTRYGPVQVQLTLDGSKITSARALRHPDSDHRSVEINSTAIPTLVRETVKAQSSHVDAVSGATYTSEGYVTSLQSALDQAHA